MLHKKLRLVGYIRSGGTTIDAVQQRAMMEQYCSEHHYTFIGCSEVDSDMPGYGLKEAIAATQANYRSRP